MQEWSSEFEPLPLTDAIASWCPRFLGPEEGDRLLQTLQVQVPWRQDPIRLFGKTMLQPRLTAWYGDREAVYTYSKLRLDPLGWLPALLDLKHRIEAFSQFRFNSVLLNLYRDGRDSMGWHSDDEPELGPNPAIASLSLGVSRRFLLRHKTRPDRTTLLLSHGSLLLMAGPMQHHWQHHIPKTKQPLGPRLNLTFRQIYPSTP